MPLTGEYEPSTSERTRRQVELFEKSNGTEGTTLRGMPVIVLTTIGAKSGKLRKNALMRVEHDGEYAVVASLGGSPTRTSSCRTARPGATTSRARPRAPRRCSGGSEPWWPIPTTPPTSSGPNGRSRCSC